MKRRSDRLGPDERMVAHVETEHLLLGREALRLLELEVGDRQAVVEHRAVVGGIAAEVEEAHRPLVAFTAAAQGRSTIGSKREQPLDAGGRASRTRRVDQRLDRVLVEHRRVDALAEVVEVDVGTVRAPLEMSSDTPSPTLRTAESPNRIASCSPSTAASSHPKSLADRLTSGTSTGSSAAGSR